MAALGAGLGLKAEHFGEASACRAEGLWFEVHAENYLVAGGPRLGWLETVRRDHPVSLHGVSLSLAGAEAPDAGTLAKLAALVRRIEPALVSEHLAWSRRGGVYLPDLLPFPRSDEALGVVCAHVAELQDALGRPIALENPSHYLALDGHDWDEIDFLAEIVRRTGCQLLLDINNVHVSCTNQRQSTTDYLALLPLHAVGEIHLAGYTASNDDGAPLLIDTHGAPVCADVWALYEQVLLRIGARPTLIEWDTDVPEYSVLRAEAARAQELLDRCAEASDERVAA